MKPTCRILWAGNLLMSDLTFGPSFKVKQWFTGFGELSFRWIQICISSLMHRSSFILFLFILFFQFLDSPSQKITLREFHQEVAFNQYFTSTRSLCFCLLVCLFCVCV